jgi:lipid-binding SYLF domain-containing protein
MRPVKFKRYVGYIRAIAFMMVAALMLVATSQTCQAKTPQEIEASVSDCLSRFYHQINGGREMVAMAEGVLVMPDVLKVGLVVGGEYGEGALRIGGKTVSYYSLASGSVGLQVGGQAKDIVILFMTDEALKQFQAGNGWEVGVDGNIALVNIGGGERLDFLTMNDPIIGFVFDVKGVMADISLKGAKFSKITPQ